MSLFLSTIITNVFKSQIIYLNGQMHETEVLTYVHLRHYYGDGMPGNNLHFLVKASDHVSWIS